MSGNDWRSTREVCDGDGQEQERWTSLGGCVVKDYADGGFINLHGAGAGASADGTSRVVIDESPAPSEAIVRGDAVGYLFPSEARAGDLRCEKEAV